MVSRRLRNRPKMTSCAAWVRRAPTDLRFISRIGLLLLIAAGRAPADAAPTFVFSDATADSLIVASHSPTPGMASGAAAADFDADGDVDLFIPQNVDSLLYRNRGDATFEEIAAAAGLGSLSCRGALWVDYDNDGDLDLFAASDSGFRLLRNDSAGGFASFTDVTPTAGDVAQAAGGGHLGGLSAGDVDNDGWIDLHAAYWGGEVYFFRNQGPDELGTVTFVESAATTFPGGDFFHSWQSVMADVDGDGRIDLYQARDAAPNHLWINQGDGTFEDVAAASGSDHHGYDMGVTVGDYDNDGDLDLYMTQISGPACSGLGASPNALYRNDSPPGGPPSFADVAVFLDVADASWGWGTTFLDADRDGDLDLAATNGFNLDSCLMDPARFFLNPGDQTAFLDVSTDVGFANTDWGSALLAFDFDRDGDLDLLQVGFHGDPLRLLRNDESSSNNYLVVRPRTTCRNRFALGAVVRVEAGGQHMMRVITAGTSMLGQEPAEAFFGLGQAGADVVTVEWPDGTVTTRHNVAGNQVLTITQPPTVDCDGNGVEDACDAGPFPLSVAAEGARYLGVTPDFSSSLPVALRVTEPGGDPEVACFVQTDGSLAVTPVFRTPAQWCRVHVHGAELVPETTYEVRTYDGTALSPTSSATTWRWGDVNDDGIVDFVDVGLVVDGINLDFSRAALEAMDQAPPLAAGTCEPPDRIIDQQDIDATVDAFQGQAFPCPQPSLADSCTLCAGGCSSNGQFCDGDEQCDAILGCVSTGDPCPPQTVCNEFRDSCIPRAETENL